MKKAYKYHCNDCGETFYSERHERKDCPYCKSTKLILLLEIEEEVGFSRSIN